jgi:murein DD-endopeptidase MepM/ murein hydrolase activator NlpD
MVVAVLSAICAAPASASAQSTGGTAFGGSSAPVPSAPPAVASTVTCRIGCSALNAARPGGTVRVLGSRVAAVTQVVFAGRRGSADDVSAPARVVDATHVEAVVPQGAHSGPVQLVNADGTASRPTRGKLRIGRAAGAGGLAARVAQRRVLFDGTTPATLDLYGGTAAGNGVSIDLLHQPDGAIVAHWDVGPIPSGTVQSISWDATVNGVPAPAGRYEFHVAQAAGASAVRAAAAPPAAASFVYLDHMFPVRGPHTYGDGFGVARTGHTHQGVDVMAACGTPLVAARGGVVKYTGTHPAAGNYLVIDGADTGVDTVYMHLRARSPLKKGAPVRTGQPIGFVGQTGDATACHLHFEEWSAPGWYTGGAAFDPLADLKAWDALS